MLNTPFGINGLIPIARRETVQRQAQLSRDWHRSASLVHDCRPLKHLKTSVHYDIEGRGGVKECPPWDPIIPRCFCLSNSRTSFFLVWVPEQFFSHFFFISNKSKKFVSVIYFFSPPDFCTFFLLFDFFWGFL